jgi:hypothetical protein
MSKPAFFLRVAAVLTLIHAVLHTIGGVFGNPGPGPATIAFQAMKMNQFPLMGHIRSYADFYRGFGLAMTIFLTAEAVIFWQLGSLARRDARRLSPIVATFSVAYIALAANSYAYFFLAPVIVETLIAVCLASAIATAKSSAEAYAGTAQQA